MADILDERIGSWTCPSCASGLDPSSFGGTVSLVDDLATRSGELIDALLERLEYRVDRISFDGQLDPHGAYVYILWGEQFPVYVGMSMNILNRLGVHMGDYIKKSETVSVQLIKCESRKAALEVEKYLIEWYRPPRNFQGNPDRSNGDNTNEWTADWRERA